MPSPDRAGRAARLAPGASLASPDNHSTLPRMIAPRSAAQENSPLSPEVPELSCCDRKSAVLRSPRPIAPVSYLGAYFSMSSRPTSPRTSTARRAASSKHGDARSCAYDVVPTSARGLARDPLRCPVMGGATRGTFGDTVRPQRPLVPPAGRHELLTTSTWVTLSLKLTSSKSTTANRPILGPAASSSTRICASQSARRPRRANADLHSAVDTLR